MNLIKILFLSLILAIPYSAFAGGPNDYTVITTDFADNKLSAYYDLRDRSSYIQVSNAVTENITIHVQVFQHDRNCDELNFFDELTPNDTVVYDMDNIIRNNGSEVPINLNADSYGYVVVSSTTDSVSPFDERLLIGNFRIVDDSGYEYRVNMPGASDVEDDIPDSPYTVPFNTVGGANYADVVGYGFQGEEFGPNLSTVTNLDLGFSFDVFVYDMDEEPLSCDRRNFACGAVMNYGINEDYPNSKEGPLLCPGGGLANPSGGHISLDNGTNDGLPPASDADSDAVFVHFIGLNNNNGTGSMDNWTWFNID